MDMSVSFGGGMKVDVQSGTYLIKTDQPVTSGGGGTAPAPFELFLASIGACAGLYVFRFCQQRKISTEGIEIDVGMDSEGKIDISIALPESIPDKYKGAILRSADSCAVKKFIESGTPISTHLRD